MAATTTSAMGSGSGSGDDPVGDFYVHLLQGEHHVSSEMTSSTKLLTNNGGKIVATVIHFYDGSWGGYRPCAAQMEIWAESAMGEHVQFLCVCVESLGVAKQFAKLFKFRFALNAYIPSRAYFPKGYGQLGCSGFVIADAHGNFISRKTRAFLQYGDQAFAHVEQLLDEQKQRRIQRRATGGRVLVAAEAAEETVTNTSTNTNTTSTTPSLPTSTSTMEDYYLPPPSVGVDVMDHEHQACAAALKELLLRRTRAALERVIQQLESHFAHEEALMVAYRFGGDGRSEFSALSSHVQDHGRILQIGRDELERLEQQKKYTAATAAAAAACNSSSTTTS